MEEKRFEEFVWAKIIGYPYWPATIIQPALYTPKKPANLTDAYLVYFCGTHEYAWIQKNHIKPYMDKKFDTFRKEVRRNQRLKKAIAEMDDHVMKKTEDADYVVPIKTWFKQGVKQTVKSSTAVKNSKT